MKEPRGLKAYNGYFEINADEEKRSIKFIWDIQCLFTYPDFYYPDSFSQKKIKKNQY